MTDVVVTQDESAHRFVASADGEVAGFIAYQSTPGVIDLVHTEIDPAFAGQGIGGALARQTLDQIRAQGLKVVPTCPFVKGWMDKHPDYSDLLT